MTSRSLRCVSRRTVIAAAPLGVLSGAAARVTRAQPVAADPVSFYLGQVLALATLQAQAIGRLRPLLISPDTASSTWQAAAAAEAGVIGAVASVLMVMDPPPDLTASVGELRLASEAYHGAALAAQCTTGGDMATLDIAGAKLAAGATHILLWLDALTAETGNDWGDGLRTLTEEASRLIAVDDVQVETLDEPVSEARVLNVVALEEPVEDAPTGDDPADVEPLDEKLANGQARNRQNRQNRQNQQGEEPRNQEGGQNRQNPRNRQDRERRTTDE